MDKKNTLIGLIFVGLGLVMMVRYGQDQARTAEQAHQAAIAQAAATAAATATEGSTAPAAFGAPVISSAEAEDADPLFSRRPAAPAAPALPEQVENAVEPADAAQTYTLENDHIRVTFTSRGAAIVGVEFIERNASGGLRYPLTVGSDIPYTFNAGAPTPALTLGLAADDTTKPTDYVQQYAMSKHTETEIQFYYSAPNGSIIVRGYRIEASGLDNMPYLIHHETKLENGKEHSLSLPALYLNVGSVPPTEGDYMSYYLNFGYYDGADNDAEFYQLYKMKGIGGMFGAGSLQPQPAEFKTIIKDGQPQVEWASVKNQFFATVLTPLDGLRGSGIFAEAITLQTPGGELIGATGALRFNLGELAPGESKTIATEFYCGPKEYLRLAKLGEHQDEVMQFGYLAAISKMLLWALVGIHNVIVYVAPNWAWGWAIIVLTVIIKAILWPLTQVQVRSSKRMAKIQKPVAELREKYKDNPQKMNQEMMKLWKIHKVNPLAGCLPILVQFPIFIGLFFMLRTSSELRFAPFLWVKDLSAPEHLFSWGMNIPFLGEYFNLLPLLMGLTMFFQMRMTPTPTTDNMQRKIFQFMPFIFLLFCYRFPSGLVIYWTGQNLISIFQQWLTNRRKDDDSTPVAPAAPAGGKKVKKLKKARA